MKFKGFPHLGLILIVLFFSFQTDGQGGLRLVEMVDGVEVFSSEQDVEFLYSGPRQQFSKIIILINTGDDDINLRLKPGSNLKGKQFELKSQPGFPMKKGERKEMEMTFLSATENFVSWETGFIVVGRTAKPEEILLHCVARKDITTVLNTTEMDAWEDARELHSQESYEKFLKAFPSSQMSKEANLRIRSIQNDTASRTSQVIDRKLRADLEKAVKSNDEQAINAFLRKHEKYPQKEGLIKHIEDLKERSAFEQVALSTDKKTLRDYVEKYPKGQYTYFIKGKLNERVVIPAEVQKGLDEIRGQLLYFIPDSMVVDKAYRVDMTIQRIKTSSKIKLEKAKTLLKTPKGTEKRSNDSGATIEIGKIMRAELIDSNPEKRFHVVPFGDKEKLVDLSGKDYTLWQWDVVPLISGRHYLNFLVEIVVKTQEGTFSEAIPVYKKKIYVESIPGFWAKNGLMTGGGIGGLALVFLIFFLNKKRKSSDGFVEARALEINSIPDRVIYLVKNNKLKLALTTLDNFLENKDNDLAKDVVLLKSSLTGLMDQKAEGTISTENLLLESNRIRSSILEIADLLKAGKQDI